MHILPKLDFGTIKLIRGNDDFFSVKYLVELVNFNQLSDSDIEYLYSEVKLTTKKILINNCDSINE